MGNKLNMVGHTCDPNLGSKSRKMKSNSKVKITLSFTRVCHRKQNSLKPKSKKKKKKNHHSNWRALRSNILQVAISAKYETNASVYRDTTKSNARSSRLNYWMLARFSLVRLCRNCASVSFRIKKKKMCLSQVCFPEG